MDVDRPPGTIAIDLLRLTLDVVTTLTDHVDFNVYVRSGRRCGGGRRRWSADRCLGSRSAS